MPLPRTTPLRLSLLIALLAGSALPAFGAAHPGHAAVPARHAARRAAALNYAPAARVEDIHTGTPASPSGPAYFTLFDGSVYFAASHPSFGEELWRTNGSTASTRLVADICPGKGGGLGEPLVVGSRLYFSANDCSNGQELWTSDGTVTNTLMVRDIYTGTSVDLGSLDANSASPDLLTEFQGELFFEATHAVSGRELWKTDGTHAGTVLVKDIVPGSSSANIEAMVVFTGSLFVVADGGSSNFGEELWISDGTEAGTVRLTDINPNAGDANINNLTVVDDLGRLFFTADDGTHGLELWSTDGTLAGTAQVKDIRPLSSGSVPSNLAPFGSRLLFSADSTGTDRELWSTDGTEGGTVEIDINAAGASQPIGMFDIGGTALLAARHQDSAFMPWLWSTDGLTVTKIAEINAGGSGDPYFTPMGGSIYFRAYDVDSNLEVWKTDGTPPNTEMLKDINPTGLSNPFGLTAVANRLLFSADDGTTGSEPWISDGTEAGTEQLANLYPEVGQGSPLMLAGGASQLFFFGFSGDPVVALWQSSDLAGASMVTDTVILGAEPYLLPGGQHALFQGSGGATGTELWVTDGTPPGTTLVKDIHSSGNSSPHSFAVLTSTVYFAATDAAAGEELWSTQGTLATTNRVADIRAGAAGSEIGQLTAYSGQMYFFADDGVFGRELWRTNGTTTTRLSDISPGAGDATDSNSGMAVSSGTLYFSADTSGDGDNFELWKYNGSSVSLVAEINPSESSTPQQLTDAGGTLYFVADDSVHGHELWKVVGGVASLVADIAPGPASAGVQNLTPVGSTLFFAANDGTHGLELWKVQNGSASLVEDIYPGTTGSLPSSLVNVMGTLIFAAGDPQGGYELWQSDGTAGGTAQIEDILAGPRNSNPTELTVVRDRLYFGAFDPAHGDELWGLDLGIEFLYLPVLRR